MRTGANRTRGPKGTATKGGGRGQVRVVRHGGAKKAGGLTLAFAGGLAARHTVRTTGRKTAQVVAVKGVHAKPAAKKAATGRRGARHPLTQPVSDIAAGRSKLREVRIGGRDDEEILADIFGASYLPPT
jgi:hypothetical protein